MGIKKNAYLRDFVRAVIASQREYLIALGTELSNAYNQFKGNIDEGVNAILNHPDKFPVLSKVPLSLDDTAYLVNTYLGKMRQTPSQEPLPDILQEARKNRPAMSREALFESRQQVQRKAPEHTEFFQYLNSERESLYRLLSQKDINNIVQIFDDVTGGPYVLAKKIHPIFVRAYLRAQLSDAPNFLRRVESMYGPLNQHASKNATAYKVVMSYIDSLDIGI